MATKISICNDALVLLGEDSISELTGTEMSQKLCNQFFNSALKELLGMHDWTFASKRAVLAQLSASPLYGYDYQYQLPADLVQIREIYSEIDYVLEQGKLLTDTNSAEIYIRYTFNVTNYNLLSVEFLQALTYYLASKIAYPLTQSQQLDQVMMGKYQYYIDMAMDRDAAHSEPDVIPKAWEKVGNE